MAPFQTPRPSPEVLPRLFGVLELQVAGRHVGVGEEVARIDAHTVGEVPLVDDHQAEGVENRALQGGVEAVGMAVGQQTHLAGEREVEPRHLAVMAAARQVGDRPFGHGVPERVPPVQPREGRIVRFRTARRAPL